MAQRTLKGGLIKDAQLEKSAKRRAEALGYRKHGYTYHQIGEWMKCSHVTAYNLVKKSIKDIYREDACDLVDLELARLDDLQASIAEQALAGNLQALDAYLKIMDRRARYVGINAPTKLETTGKNGDAIKIDIPDTTPERQLAALALLLAKSPKPTIS